MPSNETSKKPLKVAAAQFNAIAGNLGHNIKTIISILEEAAKQKVRIVVFPELSISGYHLSLVEDDRCTINENGSGLHYLLNACKMFQIYAVVGACIGRPEGIFNSAFIINDNGEIIGTYDKNYLDSSEKGIFNSGNKGFLFKVDHWKFSIGISNDSSNSEHARSMALNGAEGYLVLGAYVNGASEHRGTLYFSERAKENSIYVVFSNFIGAHGGMDYCGHSGIYTPDGLILSDCGSDKIRISIANFEESELLKNRSTTQIGSDIVLNPVLNEG